MRGVNRILLVGRVGADPELKISRSGLPWCALSIATDRSVQEAEGWTTKTDWHRVRLFGRNAERAHRRVRRGTLVAVDGPLVYETWSDDDGKRRTSARIVADRLELLAGLRDAPPKPELPSDQAVTLPLADPQAAV